MKDLFSGHADVYSKYRPGYPEPIIQFILSHCKEKAIAWDCATGNGQFATLLSEHVEKVYATDISEQQLSNAVSRSNIEYQKQPAEKTTFPDNFFHLITVAQAYHWFNFDAFETEAKRVGKPGAVIAIIGYNLLQTADVHINSLINHFYHEVVGPYWQSERKYLEENYTKVPFRFHDTVHREFPSTLNWQREDLAGYLRSWSSVQQFIKVNGYDPVDAFSLYRWIITGRQVN